MNTEKAKEWLKKQEWPKSLREALQEMLGKEARIVGVNDNSVLKRGAATAFIGLKREFSEIAIRVSEYFGELLFSELVGEIVKHYNYSHEWLIKAQEERLDKRTTVDGLFLISVYMRDFYRVRGIDIKSVVSWASVFYELHAKALAELEERIFFNALGVSAGFYAEESYKIVKREIFG